MRKLIRIIGVSTIAILYCFVIGYFSINTSCYKVDTSVKSSLEVEVNSSSTSNDLYHHVIKIQQSVSGYSISFAKSGIATFNLISGIGNRILFNKISQYLYFTQNVFSRLKNTDIIFPFHYFW